jgi:ketosteroid isomerase-like protein
MSRIFLAFIMVGLVGVAACQRGTSTVPPAASAPTIVSTDAAAEQVAVQLVKDWIDAIPKRDTGRINEVLADDFVAILPDGRKVSKADHLKEITSGSYTPVSFELTDTDARVFGDTAIVTYYQVENSKSDSQNVAGMMSAWTDILANRNGQWQVVAEHGSYFD